MSDAIRDVTGDEARLLAIQFLGQNLGEMKELDKHIVSSLKPIAPAINPTAMVSSIPVSHAPVQQQPSQQPVQQFVLPPVAPIPTPQPVIEQPVLAVTTSIEQQVVDPNQLELNFNASPYTERVFDKIEAIERKLSNIAETQQDILTILAEFKKKNSARKSAVVSLA
jgi:hypothetical protein